MYLVSDLNRQSSNFGFFVILDDLAFRIIEPPLYIGQQIDKGAIRKLPVHPQGRAVALLGNEVRKQHGSALDKLHVKQRQIFENDWPRNALLRLSWLPGSRLDLANSLAATTVFLPTLSGRQLG